MRREREGEREERGERKRKDWKEEVEEGKRGGGRESVRIGSEERVRMIDTKREKEKGHMQFVCV